MKPHQNSTQISLMLSDVDGALVTDDKVVTPRARAAHIGFTITSGRPPRGMKALIDDLKIDTIVAGFNGGVFVKPDLTVIEARFLPRAVAALALEIIGQHELAAWIYTDTEWFVPDANGAHVAREAFTINFEAKVSHDFDSLLGRAAKIVGVSDDLHAVAQCEAVLQSELRGEVSAQRSQSYYLDVTHPEANKGGVLEYLSRYLRIAPTDIATIGDMPSDVKMFEKSGVSIAMGNASAEVQAQADFVTLSNEEDGFAYAMDKFVLPTAASIPTS